MKKITVKLTAIVLSAFIFLGGVGGSYIEGYCAGSGTRFLDVVWNYDDSVGVNILQYVSLIMACGKAYLDPTKLSLADAGIAATTFLTYMNSDKGIELTEEEIPQYFEDNVSTVHESADGTIHGGGGMVLPDDLVDALHHTAQAILDEQSGYLTLPTLSINDINPGWFQTKSAYDAFCQTLKNFGSLYVFLQYNNSVNFNASDYYKIGALPSLNFYTTSYNKLFKYLSDGSSYDTSLYLINPDWTTSLQTYFIVTKDSSGSNVYYDMRFNETPLDPGNTSLAFGSVSSFMGYQYYYFTNDLRTLYFTLDGHPMRVWPSLESFKKFDVGKQPYYCTPEWVNYDYSQDNSMTLTNTYLGNVVNGGVVNNYYNVVQDAIDENNTDGTLTEDQIRDIVTDTINRIQTDNNTDHSGDSGNSGNDDGSGGGIGAVIDGIGKFFDTLLTLVGKIIGMLSDFVNSVLTMFESFTVFTDGFSGFLTGAFGFIPPEAINVLVTGMTLLVILAIIKFLK